MRQRDVVITGIGLVTSLGEGSDTHWEALHAPDCRPVLDETGFAPWMVHPLPALDLDLQIPKRGDQRQMEPWQRLNTYAAGLAPDDAGARDLVGETHLVVAAGGGERDVALDEQITAELAQSSAQSNDGGARLNEMLATGLRPTLFLAQLSNLVAGNISIVHGVTGSSRTLMGEEVAAADALRIARARISEGRGEIALVGGGFAASRWDMLILYARSGLWQGGFRPLSEREGGGMVLGSMAAYLVLEAADHARARGARALARLDAVATDSARRSTPGQSAAAAMALLPLVGGPAHAVISGASGAPAAWAEEERFLASLGEGGERVVPRRTGSLIGHGLEGAFMVNTALAALALSRDGFYPSIDPADPETAEAVAPRRILVTGFGQWRGEALASLSKAEA